MAARKPTQHGDAAYRHIKALITDAHLGLTKNPGGVEAGMKLWR